MAKAGAEASGAVVEAGHGLAVEVGGCGSDADCDDTDPCATDTCVDGRCSNEAECTVDSDCDDFNVCTMDECIDGCCEIRPQCFGSDDCPENHDCVYNCCSRCPGCHQILRVRTRCRRGHLKVVAILRNEDCDGNRMTIEVDGEPSECEVRGRIARCDVRRVRESDTTVCVTGPDCPEHCYDVQCGR
jgi:hypothetical protein